MGKVIEYKNKIEILTNKYKALGKLTKRDDKIYNKLFEWYAEHLRLEREG